MTFLYRVALERADIERLDVRRSALRERFVLKLEQSERFSHWIPLNETPVYALRNSQHYVELPFRTERLRGAPIYSFRCVLNFLVSERGPD